MKKKFLNLLFFIPLLLLPACRGNNNNDIKELENITINEEGIKTNYYLGESFDNSGIIVTANYSDGSNEDVTQLSSYTPRGALSLSDTKITYSYTYKEITKIYDIHITVTERIKEKTLESIRSIATEVKLDYKVGEYFDPTGLQVYARYSDNSESLVTNYTYSPTGALTLEDKLIFISYSEGNITKKDQLSITVSEEIKDDVIDLGKKTIQEVKDLCKQYVTDLNSAKIGVDMTHKVTIEAKALDRFNLLKTTSKYGYNISEVGKVLVGDASGAIVTASKAIGEGTSFFGKVGNYANKDDSKYVITGYLSIYLGKPEIYIPDRPNNYDPSLNVSYDPFNSDTITVSEMYTKWKGINYNAAGHGYDDVYNVKSVKCLTKNDNSYSFSDGEYVFKAVAANNVKFSVGGVYNIAGLLTTLNWQPAIRVLEAKYSADQTLDVSINNLSQDITTAQLKAIKTSQEDTLTRMDSFIDNFKNIYHMKAYVSYYTQNNKYYLCFRDTYYEGSNEIVGRTNAHNNYQMVDIENDNCWNITENEMFNYSPFKDEINEQIQVDIYFSLWQLDFASKKPLWKVLIYI